MKRLPASRPKNWRDETKARRRQTLSIACGLRSNDGSVWLTRPPLQAHGFLEFVARHLERLDDKRSLAGADLTRHSVVRSQQRNGLMDFGDRLLDRAHRRGRCLGDAYVMRRLSDNRRQC